MVTANAALKRTIFFRMPAACVSSRSASSLLCFPMKQNRKIKVFLDLIKVFYDLIKVFLYPWIADCAHEGTLTKWNGIHLDLLDIAF